jgi:hypothetical protein
MTGPEIIIYVSLSEDNITDRLNIHNLKRAMKYELGVLYNTNVIIK